MIIYPAIDIKEGNVVRLLQGKFDEVTEYGTDPMSMAEHWKAQGAEWLHLVDLDGALEGTMKNKEIIIQIAQSIGIPVQTGGGIRDEQTIEKLIEGGLSRVILGTRVLKDRSFLKQILAQWSDKIAISVDCNNGMVAQHGWTTTSDVRATDFIQDLESLGVSCVIYTDIARDGMLGGPNYESLEEILSKTKIPIIASGGIASIEDIRKLKKLESKGVMGAITGKAIYEEKLNLKEALKIAK